MSVNLPEALLRLACTDCKEYTIESEKEEFVRLNERARGRQGRRGRESSCGVSHPVRGLVLVQAGTGQGWLQ